MRSFLCAGSIFILSLTACVTNRVSQNEAMLLPEANKGKWWIINTVVQDMHGKDVHFNLLMSLDKMIDKNYAACFAAVWNETDSIYYTGARTSPLSPIKPRKKYPLRVSFPGNDSLTIDWGLVLNRAHFNFLTELKNKRITPAKNYTELSASFNKQNPFPVSVISAAPQAWAVDPVTADVKMSGNMRSSGPGKLWIRIFSDKDLLLKKSSGAYVHWLDLSLNTGKQLGILFSTDAGSNTKTEAVLLWSEQGKIMARPQLTLKKTGNDKEHTGPPAKRYPLFFSIELPELHLNITLQPRMVQQEITANRNSFWMGAVEAVEKESGQIAGKGNMYIFKQ